MGGLILSAWVGGAVVGEWAAYTECLGGAVVGEWAGLY